MDNSDRLSGDCNKNKTAPLQTHTSPGNSESSTHAHSDPSSDVACTNFQGRNLSHACFHHKVLDNADFTQADLTKASFDRCSLKSSKFNCANLTDCSFEGTDLRRANLENSQGLAAPQLAGTVLTGANLPEKVARFELLDYANDLSKDTQKLFAGVLLACAYCWLTVANTADANLFRNASSSELPIIKTSVPLSYLYIVAPLFLLVMYVHFHIYMQRFWEALALLPSVFPDGVDLRQKILPWIYNGFIFAHLPAGSTREHALSRVQRFVCVVLAWWLIPITLALLWVRFLRRQDVWVSVLQCVILTTSVAAAVYLSELARRTLRERRPSASSRNERAILAISAFLTFCISFALSIAVERIRPPLMQAAINLQEAEVSLKPAGWEDRSEEFSRSLRRQDQAADTSDARDSKGTKRVPSKPHEGPSADEDLSHAPEHYLYSVQGALLAPTNGQLNLQRMRAFGAFLVNADLHRANLRDADLTQADLRGALLKRADLTFAHLVKARLNFAKLQEATLVDADLTDADLRRADFFRANLTRANLSRARLDNTLISANLQNADLTGSRIVRARLVYCQLQEANLSNVDGNRADLTRSIIRGGKLTDANLEGANLTETDLSRADLRWADLSQAILFRTSLKKSHLQDANFVGADFSAADLKDAELAGTNLCGAKLRYAKGLTAEQIRSAFIDNQTECPRDLLNACRDNLKTHRSCSATGKSRPAGQDKGYR